MTDRPDPHPRCTAGGVRVTVFSEQPGEWLWTDEYETAPAERMTVGPFPTSAAAYIDAQATLGADVRIVQHKEPEPQK